jgi:zinc transporter ZupT
VRQKVTNISYCDLFQQANASIHDNYVENKPWGAAIGAALLVNMVTLIGVVVFVPAALFGRRFIVSSTVKECILHIALPSFAGGALLATAVYILIPESYELLGAFAEANDGHNHRFLEDGTHAGEEEHAWKAGTAILGGYFLPFVMQALFPHSHVPGDLCDSSDDEGNAHGGHVKGEVVTSEHCEKDVESDEIDAKETTNSTEDIQTAEDDDATPPVTKIESIPDYSLAVSILAGDFFHNFCDGIFIGTAFLLCARGIALTVTITTVFHELSQELADFFLLTGECRFPVWKALALNFISGLSVVLGVIVIFAANVSNATIAILLAMSSGVYLYIALTECAPRIKTYLTNHYRRLVSFLCWVVGAVPIGLVLLNHRHC